jgi:cell division protease FtsH
VRVHVCALNRSFDRSIEVRRPDYQGRLEGIKVHLREKPIAADIDYAELATMTGGMSGAQLAGALAPPFVVGARAVAGRGGCAWRR